MSNKTMVPEAAYTKPHPSIPNIWAAFPSQDDWRRVRDPHHRAGDFEAWFQDEKRDHEDSIIRLVKRVLLSQTGKVVLDQINARREFHVLIFPFDFAPPEDRKESIEALEIDADRHNGNDPHVDRRSRGTGSAVGIFFDDDRGSDDPDQTLLHELFHAARSLWGASFLTHVNHDYGTNEEFLANTVEMIYKSEKYGKAARLRDYGGRRIDPKTFLDDPNVIPSRGQLLLLFSNLQPRFFKGLAAIGPRVAAFNPIRQVDEEYYGRPVRRD
jgi:hypothetical protein